MLTEAIISGLGSLANGMFSANAQSVANAKNMELANYAARVNYYMWMKNNQYNSPIEQRKRLQAAGLNPNLVYGNGVTGNTSGSTPQYDAPDIKPVNYGRMFNPQDALMVASQIEQMKANTELAKTSQDVRRQEVLESAARTAARYAEKARTEQETYQSSKLFNYSMRAQEANIQKMLSDVQRNEMATMYQQAEMSLIPVRKKLTEAQFDNLVMATAQAKWDLQNEYAGRIPKGMDLKSWFFNQVIRANTGLSNVFSQLKKNGFNPENLLDIITKNLF